MTVVSAPAGVKPSGPARFYRHAAKLLPYLYAAIGVIAVWWAVVLIFKPHMSLLPSPLLTAQTFVQLVSSGELPR